MGNKKSFRLLPNPFASLPPVYSFPVVPTYSLKGAALLFSVGENDEWGGKTKLIYSPPHLRLMKTNSACQNVHACATGESNRCLHTFGIVSFLLVFTLECKDKYPKCRKSFCGNYSARKWVHAKCRRTCQLCGKLPQKQEKPLNFFSLFSRQCIGFIANISSHSNRLGARLDKDY